MKRLETTLRALTLVAVVLAGTLALGTKAYAYETRNGYQSPFTDSFLISGGLLVTQYGNGLAVFFDPFYAYDGQWWHKVWQISGGGCIYNGYQQERSWGVALNVIVGPYALYDNYGWLTQWQPAYTGASGMCQYANDKPFGYQASMFYLVGAYTGAKGHSELHYMAVYGSSTTWYGPPHSHPYTATLY